MLKFLLAAAIIASMGLAAAQTAAPPAHKTPTHKATVGTAKKPAARPNPNVPSKVTGAGTTTASGLKYWDVKVGTGATAAAG